MILTFWKGQGDFASIHITLISHIITQATRTFLSYLLRPLDPPSKAGAYVIMGFRGRSSRFRV